LLTDWTAAKMLAGVTGTPDHVLRNRVAWDRLAADYAIAGLRNWAAQEPAWGIWGVPDAHLGILPSALAGADSLELGCGTGYVSAWLARRGSRPVGLDNSAAQLATAAALQDRFGLHFPLIQASAEQIPMADAAFDLVISEYGASIWCDPYAWIPEAARVLRPGGQLIFLVNSIQLILTCPEQDDLPVTETLQRPYFGIHRFQWEGSDSVEFHIGHGDMIRLLRQCGFEICDLIEVQPPLGSTTSHPIATLEWARQWPCEEVWKARKTSLT
jgi:SAM-dependent methyltransferase